MINVSGQMIFKRTVRLENVEVTLGFCFAETADDSLRRTAAEGTEENGWES